MERVWDQLGAALPECRALLGGHPVLAHAGSDVVFAFALGTAYAVWIPPPLRAGVTHDTVHRWGDGATTDLALRRFAACEETWCRAAAECHASPDGPSTE